MLGVEAGAPNILLVGVVDVDDGAAAGLLPNILLVEPVCDPPPNREPPVPPPRDGVDEAGAALLAAPNIDFCSPGLAPALPNRPLPPPPSVPVDRVVDVLLPAPVFPKEKVGVPEAAGVVDEPNSPPVAGALEVVALLVD